MEGTSIASIVKLGKYLDKNYKEIDGSRLKAAKCIAILVSAAWWPSCGPFKVKLKAAVAELKAEGKAVEVLYLSGDKDEATFKKQLSETDFITVPFSEHKKWIQIVKIDGYPYLQFLGNDGKVTLVDAFGGLN